MFGRILIVDDEPDIAEILGDRLKANGFDVEIVSHAEACYEAVAREKPDLVMLDIQMPDIGGMEVLEALKRQYPEMPVLMVTASTERSTAREAKEKGAAGFLLKPFEPDQLLETVNGILAEPGG